MTETIIVRQPTSPENAPDRRLYLTDEQMRDFSASVYVTDKDSERRTGVEVQSHAPDPRMSAIVHMVLHIGASSSSPAGQADAMLSPDEARTIAHILIVAAEEAEQITAESRAVRS